MSPNLDLSDFTYATIAMRPCDRCQGWTRQEQYVGRPRSAYHDAVLFHCLECGHKRIK